MAIEHRHMHAKLDIHTSAADLPCMFVCMHFESQGSRLRSLSYLSAAVVTAVAAATSFPVSTILSFLGVAGRSLCALLS